MARIMIISSFVTIGHVGLSAGQPVCQRLGVNVTSVPTVVLSNHPGWPEVARAPVAAEHIVAMAEALSSNGWLADHEAVLVGYMPTVEHVDAAAALLARVSEVAYKPRIVVDPILGDWPNGLYASEGVAQAVRDRLVPLANITTPNLFELEWLSQRKCMTVDDAKCAAQALGIETVHVTSAPLGSEKTGILSLSGGEFHEYCTPRYPDVPHGVGDVFAALIAANFQVGQAVGYVHGLARSSQGQEHLNIVDASADWVSAPAIAATRKG